MIGKIIALIAADLRQGNKPKNGSGINERAKKR